MTDLGRCRVVEGEIIAVDRCFQEVPPCYHRNPITRKKIELDGIVQANLFQQFYEEGAHGKIFFGCLDSFTADPMKKIVFVIVKLLALHDCVSIWETGAPVDKIPEIDIQQLSSKMFYERYQYIPFVFRKYQSTLSEMALVNGSTNPIDWMQSLIGDDDTVDSVEGELRETRLAPTIRKVKWKYFMEKYTSMDMYAVTQAPAGLRSHLKLMPAMSCGGIHDEMVSPHVWVSGGIKASKSVIHMDSYVNQHCLLHGQKRFLLIPPNQPIASTEYGWIDASEHKPEGFEDAYDAFFGLIDTDNVDLQKFPKWKDVPWYHTELRAGDCIYMPFGWYHYVESDPEITVSWHQWFNIPSVWRDDDKCDDDMHLTTANCFYSNDKHRRNQTRIDWSSFDSRTSVCYK